MSTDPEALVFGLLEDNTVPTLPTGDENTELIPILDASGRKLGEQSVDGTIWVNYLPTLDDLYSCGGIVGKAYCLAWGNDTAELQRNGWSPVQGAPYITIRGPKGDASCALLEIGSAIFGLDPNSGRRFCVYSHKITELTGVEDANKFHDEDKFDNDLEAAGLLETKPTPKETPTPTKTKGTSG